MNPDMEEAKQGLKRCLKAAFELRNDTKQVQARIHNHPDIKAILADPEVRTVVFYKFIVWFIPQHIVQ